MARFRLNALRVFLTYPQATCSKQDLYNHLTSLRTVEGVDGIPTLHVLVAQEQHEDGGTHFHCYIEFERKINITNERLFDFQNLHPNIQSVRSKKNVIKYCTKDDEEPLVNFDYKNENSIVSKLRQGLSEGLQTNEIIDKVLDEEPNAIRYYNNLHSYITARQNNSKTHLPTNSIADFTIDALDSINMQDFHFNVQTMERGHRTNSKSIWLVGPSRIGKTSLARCLGKHWYMQGIWCIDNISDEDNTYGVLDDIAWDSLKYQYKSLLGCQKDCTFTDKYRCKKTFKMGYPVIICSNELPEFSPDEKDWLRINIDFYRLTVPLFNNPNPIAWTNIFLL